MDGGGRLLRSLSGATAAFRPVEAAPALARALTLVRSGRQLPATSPVGRRRRQLENPGIARRVMAAVAEPWRGMGLTLALALILATGLYGAVKGGHYATFVDSEGRIIDAIARGIGFDIASVTVSGQAGLTEQEILSAAGITEKSSLAFLNAAAVRDHLKRLPLVKEATVTKLFPNRLVIDIVERDPYALWQKDGEVSVIAADGTVIDARRDPRFDTLPFVVGDGANGRAAEFVSLLEAAGELRPKIRAGTLVAERRWNLTMTSGVVVKLPDTNPQAAVALLAELQRSQHVIERDILSLDLRVPGRLLVRLSEEAAAARAEVVARKTPRTGGHL